MNTTTNTNTAAHPQGHTDDATMSTTTNTHDTTISTTTNTHNTAMSNTQATQEAPLQITSTQLARFILTFFLSFIGSIIINHTKLKPAGFRSRSWAYFFLGILTLGIYDLVASICNLFFDPRNPRNIGYFQE